MAIQRLTPFQAKVLRGLREEKLQIRRILRVYPPLDIGDPSEVLFIAMDGKPGTAFVDEQGKLAYGPFPGFGV